MTGRGLHVVWHCCVKLTPALKLDLKDPEGDSQMGDVTSPSTDSEDAMFPAANTEIGSGNQPLPSNTGVTLSSPPPSQNVSSSMDGAAEAMELNAGETTKTPASCKRNSAKYYPGETWNNKKARDEWQRAWSMLEDKSFSLSNLAYCIS